MFLLSYIYDCILEDVIISYGLLLNIKIYLISNIFRVVKQIDFFQDLSLDCVDVQTIESECKP